MLQKKLFCVKTIWKLPEMTVIHNFMPVRGSYLADRIFYALPPLSLQRLLVRGVEQVLLLVLLLLLWFFLLLLGLIAEYGGSL